MTLNPRAILVLPIATCHAVPLMGAADSNDVGGATGTPSEGHSAFAGCRMPNLINHHDQRSLPDA